jgi:hypothetical protein
VLIGQTEPRVLMPVPRLQWREPSLAQPKDQFGRPDTTRFLLERWRRDGGLLERFWYEDRDEFDAELWHAIAAPYADTILAAATVVTLTANPGANRTYTVPVDWNTLDNTVECIGGGGAGGNFVGTAVRHATGGGGGGYGLYAKLTLGATATYQIGNTVVGPTRSASGTSPGVAGNSTWFNGTTYALAPVGATGGGAGNGGTSTVVGGAGGTGKGTGSFNGGASADATSGTTRSTGAGGAAGRNGNGLDGIGGGSDNYGGAGDAGLGGAGGAPGSAGGAGTEMNGIGGGGGSGGSFLRNSGNGGNYGGGSGAVVNSTVGTSYTVGNGAQGAIVLTYGIPLPANGNFLMFMPV